MCPLELLRRYYARDSLEIGDDANVLPHRGIQEAEHGIAHGVADLDRQPAAGLQRLVCLLEQRPNHVQALLPRKDSDARLEVANRFLYLIGFAKTDIGRVADDEIEIV